MLPYWIVLAAAALLAFLSWPPKRGPFRFLAVVSVGIALSLFVGLRFEIGADWLNYEAIFLDISRVGLGAALQIGDPGYSLINWIVAQFGGSVWHVNLICSILIVFALLRFCLILPMPGVALVSSIPTFVIVISMGYTRQACAVAFVMLAISSFNGAFSWKWLFWLALGVTIHKSTIVVFPLFLAAASRNRMATLIVGAMLGLILAFTFVLGSVGGMIEFYFGGEVQSGGAIQRVIIAAGLGAAFFALPRASEILGDRYNLWRNMAFASLALGPMLFTVSSTTAVDRIGVLLVPFQIAVYSFAPISLAKSKISRDVIVGAIVALSLAIQGVWLFYADNAAQWLPYRNVINEPYL